MAGIFFIEVQRVESVPKAGKAKVHTQTVRGDLVIGVREWDKSALDMTLVGDDPMCQVTLMNPANGEPVKMRIAEDKDKFTSRLHEQSRQTKRPPAAKSAS